MKFSKAIFLAFLISLSNLSILKADEQAIIVTATKTTQTIDDTISPIIVIEKDIIKSNPSAAISDLLRIHAGIEIGRNGGPGQQTSLFIRGTNSNHVVVMVDGVKINPGTLGAAAIQNIDLKMVERIEVVKGPRSTLYGSDAIGGVINIITHKSKKGEQYNVNVGYGSFNTKTVGFSAQNKNADYSAGISIKSKTSDGYEIRKTSPLKRGYDNQSVQLYAKKRIAKSDVQISHWQSEGKTEYLDFFLNPLDQNYANSTTAIDVENTPSETWFSKIKISHAIDKIDQNQGVDFAHTLRDVFDWQNDLQINDAQLLSAGIYLEDQQTKASSFGTNFDEKTQTNAIYVQDDILLGQHHIIMGARNTDHETFGTHLTGGIDYAIQINETLKLTAGTATGFRSPDSTDRFGYGGNPNLKPEESTNTEFGIKYQQSKHSVAVNLFNNEISNLIFYDDPDGFAGPIVGKNENIGKAKIDGVEASYQYSDKNWNININAVDQNPINVTNDTLLLRRAKNKYNFSVGYKGLDYLAQLNISHVGQRKDVANDLNAFTLVGLSGNYTVSKNISVNGRIENITDEEYELVESYRTPERSYYIELEYNFK